MKIDCNEKKANEFQQLSRFADRLGFSFSPVNINRERPDVAVKLNGELIGIELTTGAPEEERRARVLAKKRGLSYYSLSGIQAGAARGGVSNDDLLEAMANFDFRYEYQYASYRTSCITELIRRKVEKFDEESFKKFPQNWLVIMDTGHEYAADEPYLYERYMAYNLTRRFLSQRGFDCIFVVGQDRVFLIQDQITSIEDRRHR